ncbi:hypothetical protein KFK09_018658 [Dendrobium nobile]|uniref:Uncharacterized protein n=1 Tax=Dendrobium nobile TaxID=94219 RepID=A0A8T3AUZ5_DENNO|nr:hypothetical protein KFK09_018658 [Dendrobium nobile]
MMNDCSHLFFGLIMWLCTTTTRGANELNLARVRGRLSRAQLSNTELELELSSKAACVKVELDSSQVKQPASLRPEVRSCLPVPSRGLLKIFMPRSPVQSRGRISPLASRLSEV